MALILGTRRADRLNGTAGSDLIFSLDGDDVVFAGAGNDYVDGGLGDDVLGDSAPYDILLGGHGSTRSPLDDDFMNGGAGDDIFVSVRGNDFMDGGDGDDTFLITGSGLKTVVGGAGDDTLMLNRLFVGNLSFDGGAGNDAVTIHVAPGDYSSEPRPLELSGGPGNDFIEIIGPRDTPVRQNIVVDGGDGDDNFVANGLFADLTFSGGAGDDTGVVDFLDMNGDQFPDVESHKGVDYSGGAGNDFIEIIGPRDIDPRNPVRHNIFVDGGDGDDTLLFGSLFVGLRFFGGADNDVLAPGPSYVASGPVPGWDLGEFSMSELGNAGEDVLVGGHGNDLVVGGTGDDRAEGGEGDDVLVDWEAEVELSPPGPRQTLTITADLSALGTADADTLIGGAGDDVLVGLSGNDRVEGGDGADVIIRGRFTRSIETIEGGLPDIHIEVLSMNVGAAGVGLGGAGNDQFVADFGSVLFGDDGDDTLLVTASGATPVRQTSVYGGTGGDAIRVEMPGSRPVSTLGPPEVAVFGGAGNDIVEIAGPRDAPDRQTIVVAGGGGDDVVNAAGYDIAIAAIGVAITGGRGRDTLTGTSGKDSLNGGLGADTLTGGTGNDVFEYDTLNDGPDLITDFAAGGDVFHIDLIGFGSGLAPGALPADRFVAGTDPVSVTPGDGVFLYEADIGALSWDADGAGGNAPFTIAFLTNLAALTAADFLIV
jgi:Ca2+-binding RTX toxin-like protein